MCTDLGIFMLDTDNPDHLIPIFTVSTFNLIVIVSSLVFNYPFTGYLIKIKVICRLTTNRAQALISISTIQEFQALDILLWYFRYKKNNRKQKSKMFKDYFSSLNIRSFGYLDKNSIELYSSTPMQGIDFVKDVFTLFCDFWIYFSFELFLAF